MNNVELQIKCFIGNDGIDIGTTAQSGCPDYYALASVPYLFERFVSAIERNHQHPRVGNNTAQELEFTNFVVSATHFGQFIGHHRAAVDRTNGKPVFRRAE